MKALRVGIIGCGNVATSYASNLYDRFEHVHLCACADYDETRAARLAGSFPGISALPLQELLANRKIDLILNLTPPQKHFEVAMLSVLAGKHVYNEKPLTMTLHEANELAQCARHGKVRIGCAPDTFLGAGLQCCRQQLDAGAIGTPVAVHAAMFNHGPEHWHPAPSFFYKEGAGPLFDMGPYYLSAMIFLLGPIASVTAMGQITFARRTIGSMPQWGRSIDVEVPTHVAAVLTFRSGPIATLTMSFDAWESDVPPLEIHGDQGSLSCPDPNTYGGPVRIRHRKNTHWQDIPLDGDSWPGERGIGIIEMAAAIQNNRPHRAHVELATHVLDVMHAILDSAIEGRRMGVSTTCARP